MPAFASKVTCGDGYTNAATIEGVWDSAGGSFALSGTDGDAIIQLQAGPVNQGQWGAETLVPSGSSGPLFAGTTGIRFRNAVPGAAAVVIACTLAGKREAVLSVAAGPGTSQVETMVKLYDNVLTVPASAFDIVGISPNYTALLLELQLRGTLAAATVTAGLRVNNVSVANYHWFRAYQNGVAWTLDNGGAADTNVPIGIVSAASASAGYAGAVVVEIPNYLGTTLSKPMTCRSSDPSGFGSFVAGQYNGTDAINRLTVYPIAGGNWDAGSRCTLWGL